MATGYLTADGIETVLTHLCATYPALTELITLPESSVEGRTIHGVKIGNGSSASRRGVLFLGGVHARELVNPDLLMSFTAKLLRAYTAGVGLAFGPVSYTKATVQLIVDNLDVFVVPLVNPDGRVFVQSANGDPMWRKNRNPNPGLPCKGVDLNRNYEFLWSSGIGTSSSACSDTFKGSVAFSEPETRNVRHLLDNRRNIMCLADIHSYSELVLFPWGDDNNQSTDPTMNFLNPAFDGQRGTAGSGYAEYLPSSDANWYEQAGNAVRDAIKDVRGRTYKVEQGIDLYPTSGTAHDYAYSRHFVQASKRKVLSFTIETAQEFQPPWAEAQKVIEEVSSGLVVLLVRVICAAESMLTASDAASMLTDLRTIRDDLMAASPAGRLLTSLFEVHGAELLGGRTSSRVNQADLIDIMNEWGKAVGAVGIVKAPVPGRVVDRMNALLASLAEGASTSLARDLKRFARDTGSFRERTIPDALAVITKKRRLR